MSVRYPPPNLSLCHLSTPFAEDLIVGPYVTHETAANYRYCQSTVLAPEGYHMIGMFSKSLVYSHVIELFHYIT